MDFNNFTPVSIKDVFDLIPGFAFKSNEFLESGIPVIKIKNVKSFKLVKKDFSYVSPSFMETKSKYLTKFGDLLISMTGNRIEGSIQTWVGKVCRINEEKEYFVNQRVGILRKKNDNHSAEYFCYLLASVDTQKKLISVATSSGGQANISPEQILNMRFDVPLKAEQKAIAHVLSTLDDKIEVNNRINKTLEDMAQAIFKRWFVDFEFPNEEGEPYKSSGGEMVESELGMIPKGWKVGILQDLGKVVGGSTPSKKNEDYYTQEGIAWITPKDLSNNHDVFIKKGALDISPEGLRNSSTFLLPKGSILFSSRAPIGYMAIADQELTTNQGFKSIIPGDQFGTSFVYCALKQMMEKIKSRASGSTFLEVSGSVMKSIETLIPETKITQKFNELSIPLFKTIEVNENQNKLLVSCRDKLLPKLMSGEIRIPIEES